MRGIIIALLSMMVVACAHEELQPIVVQPPAVVLETHLRAAPSGTAIRSDTARIQILPNKRPDQPSEVVGVVDAHVGMGEHERALAVLREKAAALGADAVIGVDFEHGEGHAGQPVHLSGLAVRWLNRPVLAE